MLGTAGPNKERHAQKAPVRIRKVRGGYDHEVLLLQGGGALGAFHAGVYEGLAEAGMMPTWLVGISIGAINSAIIAGNPPERRVERLRELWDRLSSYAPLPIPWGLDPIRPIMGRLSFLSGAIYGVPGFFVPRFPSPLLFREASPDILGLYDTSPLEATLADLVDFDLLNSGRMRLSLGTTNVRTGESKYFDTQHTRITAKHVLASGALPPAFPAVEIDGEQYWDGGLASNTPITYVLDQKPLRTALMVQINLFPNRNEAPHDMMEVMERIKDIQFSSKLRLSTAQLKQLGELRASIGRLLAKMPAQLKDNPDVRRIGSYYDNRRWTIAFMTDTYQSKAGQWKDADFSRATINERWAGGVEAVRSSLANRDWVTPEEHVPGVRVYYLPPDGHEREEATNFGNGKKAGKRKRPTQPSRRSHRRGRSSRPALYRAR